MEIVFGFHNAYVVLEQSASKEALCSTKLFISVKSPGQMRSVTDYVESKAAFLWKTKRAKTWAKTGHRLEI